MSYNKPNQTLIMIAVIILGFAVVLVLSNFLEKSRPSLPEGFEDSDLVLQGSKLKGYSLGFEGLIADWYWMQSLQYVGDKILRNPDKTITLDDIRELNPRLLYPYLDNAAMLDPKFLSIYEYGAMVLPAINQEQAVQIVKKGIDYNPDQWRLYHYLGYIYWKLGNYEAAGEIYEKGAAIKDAPNWMKMMGARMKSEGGSRNTARALYRQIYENAADSQTRESAALRLLQLDSLDEEEAIRAVLTNFQTRNKHCPADWREVLPQLKEQKLPNGRLLRLDSSTLAPLDPTDVPYILNRENNKCDVSLNFAESKIPAR